MNPDITLSQEIFNTIAAYYDGYLLSQYDQLMESFSVFFRTMLVLYTVYTGYKITMDKSAIGFDIIKPYLSVLVVYTCVLETNLYMDYIVDPFLDLVNDLSIYFAKGESSMLFSALDNQALKFIEATMRVWPNTYNPLDHLFAFFAYVILYFAFFTMFFAFLAVYCISYFAMNIFFLVGGIFILFGTIKETRGLFFAWLKNLCQFALTILFASITLGLTFNGIVSSIEKIEYLDITQIFTFDYLSLIAWCAITIALFLKCADFAAGITSTMAGSTAGIAGAISTAGGAAAGATAAATAAGGGAVGAAGLKLGQMSGLIPAGMSATQALKNKLGIKD